MSAILRRYPMVIAAHFKNRPAGKDTPRKPDDDLIQEALTEQQKENKRQMEEMLAQPGRFADDELGFRFALTHGEVEWLLQMFNDVRVGCWIQLGEPDSNSAYVPPDQKLNEQIVQLAWTMETAGLFLHELLEAISSADT